jgi:hypothetical protein
MERSSRPPRYFTLDEARRTLPQVRACLERLQTLGAEVTRLQQAMQEGSHALRQEAPAHNGAAKNGRGRHVYDALARTEVLLGEMRRLVGELEEIGCEVKDVQTGLVDFRAMRDGRAVYLCWRLGEDDIGFWHELDTGFAGRRPL